MVVEDEEVADALEFEGFLRVVLIDEHRAEIPPRKQLHQAIDACLDHVDRGRLQRLEEIASEFEGVEKSFAIQAGREVRIIVKPEMVNDDKMIIIARDIVKKIEEELKYPGQIKIHVIRESRAIEFAK